ncbi:hypothetical protein CUJ83_08505 [Methanocella sp. CWC-04]|uniref:FAS1 domain-containing protein n=1 Tax=Methanooceanicella nereidis TaxID=2052831 RepID=A0AAP2RCI7_9EURY|nr:fasciclin domain-containing protein [Methanocella sp. CWC-04]MCD1295036.1 hypothetical protein [Methanocella sp. CWC-04]
MADIRKILAILILLTLIFGFALPVIAQTSVQNTMLENLAANKEFSTLATAIRAAGLDKVLSGMESYTLFAPNNAAFDKFPKESISALVNDKTKLGELLKYHVVPGKLTYADLSKMTEIKTVDGKTLPIGRQDGMVTVDGTKLMGPGIESKNGMIYPISNVMTPPGFAMPQVARSTGIEMGWLPWLLGALGLGLIALYFLTRAGRKGYEAPEAAYEKERVKERVKPWSEETERAEETMKRVKESVSAYREPSISDITNIARNLELPLAGDSLAGLNKLISNGVFSDKQDFLSFLVKSYFQNDVGSMMAGGKEPGISSIMDIIDKTGIARGFLDSDIKKYIVPLLMAGFTAVYNYLRKPAVKPA